MKTIDPDLAAHLAGEATTVCQSWRVTRRDGTVLGFTEHDRDLTFGGTLFLAASGFAASESEAEAGLSVAAGEVSGGFSSEAIDAADLRAGRYDGAKVEVFLVNWEAPEQHMLLRVQEIGEVRAAGGAFRAELRRLTHRLEQVQGRVYGRRCDAVLGDGRCRFDLETPGLRADGVILEVADALTIRVSGLDAVASGFYRSGVLSMRSGDNAGITIDIDDHRCLDGNVTLSLFLPPSIALMAGDAFTATAGCDKSFSTCGEKFGNRINFQGFPHMPGTDFAFGYADGDTVHDGRPLYA